MHILICPNLHKIGVLSVTDKTGLEIQHFERNSNSRKPKLKEKLKTQAKKIRKLKQTTLLSAHLLRKKLKIQDFFLYTKNH